MKKAPAVKPEPEQLDILQRLQLKKRQHIIIVSICFKKTGLIFLSKKPI